VADRLSHRFAFAFGSNFGVHKIGDVRMEREIILKPQGTLRHERLCTKGFRQETDIDECAILNISEDSVGELTVAGYAAVRGFRRTIHVIQKDKVGKIVVDECWTLNVVAADRLRRRLNSGC